MQTLAYVLGVILGRLSIDDCRVVEKPAVVEYAARGGRPGGFWIADGDIIGFSLAEDESIKSLACFPEDRFL